MRICLFRWQMEEEGERTRRGNRDESMRIFLGNYIEVRNYTKFELGIRCLYNVCLNVSPFVISNIRS